MPLTKNSFQLKVASTCHYTFCTVWLFRGEAPFDLALFKQSAGNWRLFLVMDGLRRLTAHLPRSFLNLTACQIQI